jgi:AmiR/NasT family two-component response regulator
MTEPRLIQNFVGFRAVIVTDARPAVEQLEATVVKLGLVPDYPAITEAGVALEADSLNAEQDVLFIDSDLSVGLDALESHSADLPPVIGIIGVGAPSRLKALMRIGATAILRKPVHGGSVYSALFVGINEFRRRRNLMERLNAHERRRLGRRSLVKAILAVMKTAGCDEDQAYDRLRRESMRRRLSLEDYCDAFIRALPGASEHVPSVQGIQRADTTQTGGLLK